MVDDPVKLLFIAPASNLSSNTELARIASGHTVDIVSGMLDRAGLERALRDPADAVHFVGHGSKQLLELTDGLIDSADLVSMLDKQNGAKFFFVNSCDSLGVATAIHNSLHLPCIAHDKPINDVAAVRFAERFYREYKRSGDVGKSFEAARETLMRLYPTEANTPVLINGDMASHADISHIVSDIDDKIAHIGVIVDGLEARVSHIESALNTTLPAPMSWQVWVNMAFSLVASGLLILLLLRTL
jgi:hypothetical protein